MQMAQLSDLASQAHLTQALASYPLVVVHFWAEWCAPCKQMDAVMRTLASEHAHAGFFRVDAEALPDLTEKYDVSAVPFFVVLKGNQVVDTVDGANAPELVTKVGSHAKTAAGAAARVAPAVKPPSVTQRIQTLLQSAPVLLFMKGDRDAPRCGFSSKVVAALKETGVAFDTFDILGDEAIRQGLKEYSNWPTYPQLYVKGELLGGCDIIMEMAAEGELKQTLEQSLGVESKEALHARIKALVEGSPVMLFMKGSPSEPKCGFSRKVSAALTETGVAFDTFDILGDEAVRQGLKEYSNWPTYPQLYVKGELLGGCDIIMEMAAEGELQETLAGATA